MKNAGVAGALTLALVSLGGCTLDSVNASINSAASASLPTLCSLGASAHAAFAAIAAARAVGQAATDEAAAYAALTDICNHPPSDIASVITTAANSYATVVAALNAAKSGG